MRIHYINIKTLLMVAVCVNFFLTSASFAQVSSENSLAGQISSDDIKIRESNKAEEIKNLMGKVTEDYQSLNGVLLKETKLQVNSVDSQKPVSDNLNTIQKKKNTELPFDKNNSTGSQNSDETNKHSPLPVLNNDSEQSGSVAAHKTMLEKQNQLLLDLIELQKQVINYLDLIRDTCSSQINPQNLAKKAVTPPDFVATYAKKKGVHLDPSGFAYVLLKKGNQVVTPGMLFKISLQECTTNGKVVSQVKDVTLKYDDKLPRVVFRAVALIGIGGTIKVVAYARDTYAKNTLPEGINLDTPLVYKFSTSYP